MALFTNEDAERVLLVSQLVQVNPPNARGGESEISLFVKQWYQTGVRMATPTLIAMVTAEDWQRKLGHLTWLKELSKLILGALADRGKVHYSDLSALNDESRNHPSSRYIQPHTNRQDEEGYIEPSNLEETWGAKDPMEMMFVTVVQQLQTACLHPERVKRCAVCCNAYLSQRATGKNKFCSHRCGKRQYDRNRKKSLTSTI